MKPYIDPKVDCVLKAILGKEENTAFLIHFVNAVLSSKASVPILNLSHKGDKAGDG